jgi:hypothetical protein
VPAEPPTSLLVVTPCSATKRRAVPHPPAYEDLVDPDRRAAAFVRLAGAVVPAAELYGGAHHSTVKGAVCRLRRLLPRTRVDVAIVSAGYGVLGEHDPVIPYEATFAGLPRGEAVRRGRELGIRPELARRLATAEVALFLLGEDYLAAIEAPLASAPTELYLASAAAHLDGPGVIKVPAGRVEARRLGVAPRMVKAALFARFVEAVADDGWLAALGRLVAGDLVPDTDHLRAHQPSLGVP